MPENIVEIMNRIPQIYFTICDWADACVPHPAYQKWVEAYLRPWSAYISLSLAHEALKIAWKIYTVLFISNFIRIHECPDH